jgi:hypothetical protein
LALLYNNYYSEDLYKFNLYIDYDEERSIVVTSGFVTVTMKSILFGQVKLNLRDEQKKMALIKDRNLI